MKLVGSNCSTNVRSSGTKGCPFFPGNAKGHILVPYDFAVAVAETDSDTTIASAIIAAIQAAFVEDVYSEAAQFFGKYVGFEDKSEAAPMQKFNYNISTKVGRTKYMHEYQHMKGMDYHNFMLTFQGKHEDYKVITVEDGGRIRGAKKYDANGNLTHFMGLELDGIDVNDMKEGTINQKPEFKCMLTYADASELNENAFVVSTGVNMFDVIAAVEVTDLYAIPFAGAARVHPFMIKTIDGSINVADTLGTLLDDTSLIKSCVNKTSGVAIAVTSVAVNTLTGKYVVTFTAGAGYVNGQTAIVEFADVSDLHALDADYYRFTKKVEITMAT